MLDASGPDRFYHWVMHHETRRIVLVSLSSTAGRGFSFWCPLIVVEVNVDLSLVEIEVLFLTNGIDTSRFWGPT